MSDIGRVELGTFTYGNLAITNGQPASVLILYQAPGSNALATGQAVRDAMVRLAERFPPDVEYLIPFEAVSVVQVSIEEVAITLAIALGLVTVVVFIFLQRWRATLVPLVAIPVSIVGTFIFFTPLGFTINTITLFGFVLAIGIVVDDAIVVVEAIQAKMEEDDMDVREAASAALADVATPVITTSVILAAIFLPVAFVPGLTGQLYQQFAVTISLSVLISSLVALSLGPALAIMLFRKDQEQPGWLKKVFGPFNRGFEKLTSGYDSAVAWTLAHRWVIGLAFAGVLAGTYLLFAVVPSAFVPTEDDGRIFVTFELPEASATGRTVEVMREMMTVLDSVEQIESYTAVAGLNAITFTQRSNTGTIFCQLQPWGERTEEGEGVFALVGQLQRAFAKTILDARVVVIPPAPIPGLGSTSGFSFALQDRGGTADVAEFEATLQNFLGAINGREEIDGAFSFFTAQKPSYRLDVDRVRAKQLGVPLPNIYTTIQTFLGSSYINDFTRYGRTFRVVAQADTAYRTSIDDLDRYFVRNSEGTMVPLSSLISYELTSTAPLIQHYNLFRSATVTGNPAEGFTSGEAIAALQEEAAEVAAGLRVRVFGPDPGGGGVGRDDGLHFRAVAAVRLPDPHGAVRIVDGAVFGLAGRADGDLRGPAHALARAGRRAQRLRADRLDCARRARGQGLNFDRGVRQAPRRGGHGHRRGDARGGAAALPPDFDDERHVHHRDDPAGDGRGRRGQLTPGHWVGRDRGRDHGHDRGGVAGALFVRRDYEVGVFGGGVGGVWGGGDEGNGEGNGEGNEKAEETEGK